MFPMASVCQVSEPHLQPQGPDQDVLMLLAPEGDGSGSAEGAPLLQLAGINPVRKRSRGQSGNSQASGSSDQSSSTADLSVCMDDANDDQQGDLKRVHFCGQPPEIIPDSMNEATDMDDSIDIDSVDARVCGKLERTELASSD